MPVRVPTGFSDADNAKRSGKTENTSMTTPTMWRHPVSRNQRPAVRLRVGPWYGAASRSSARGEDLAFGGERSCRPTSGSLR